RADHRRRAGEPVRHQTKGGVRRRRRPHDQVEFNVTGMIFEPLPAVVAGLVDDNGHAADAGGAEALERMTDQWPSSDRHHGLADAVAVGAQAAPLACGNDAAPEGWMRGCGNHCRIFVRSRRSVTDGSACGAPGPARTSSGAIQMKRMPIRRAPSRSRLSESPMNTVVSAVAPSRSRAARKIAGSGFSAPTQWLSTITLKKGQSPALSHTASRLP